MACDTQTIPGGTAGLRWLDCQVFTFSQVAWGNRFETNPTLFGGYITVYGAGGVVEVGTPGPLPSRWFSRYR